MNGTIRVKLAVTPELLEQALTEKTWSVGLLGGYGSWKTPRVRTGTLISGGPGSERDAVESEKHIRSYLAGLRMETPWGAIDFEYVEGDEKSRATEPVGGAQVGFVYYQPASSGSLGLNTGANGGRFRIETELKQYELRYTAPYLFHRSLPAEQYISEKSPEFIFGRTETRYSSSARSINLPGIFTKTHQKVEENRFGIGIRGNHTRRLTDSITGTVGANVALYYRDAELDSTQRNVCGAPGCPATNTFTANNTDSDSGFTWGAGVSARLDYSFTRHSSLGIQFNYDYLNETAALKNPTSTINISGPPHLESTSVYAWRGALRYRYMF